MFSNMSIQEGVGVLIQHRCTSVPRKCDASLVVFSFSLQVLASLFPPLYCRAAFGRGRPSPGQGQVTRPLKPLALARIISDRTKESRVGRCA